MMWVVKLNGNDGFVELVTVAETAGEATSNVMHYLGWNVFNEAISVETKPVEGNVVMINEGDHNG